jgi:aerobic carbon-monoxide dehydrogenase large subunit
LLRGRGQFAADIPVPDALHLAFVRSPYARARLRAVDLSGVEAMPGVVAVFTSRDLGPVRIPDINPLLTPAIPLSFPLLAEAGCRGGGQD